MLIQMTGPKARVRIHHEVAYDRDERTGLWLTRAIDEDEEVENIITNAGRVQLHAQCYNTGGLSTNGFNYIGLSDDATAPAETDTALPLELSGNGLDRAQGAVLPPIGSGNQTQIQKVFTYTGMAQSVQKSALFMTPAGGVMAHEVVFIPRVLSLGDNLTVTYVITLG